MINYLLTLLLSCFFCNQSTCTIEQTNPNYFWGNYLLSGSNIDLAQDWLDIALQKSPSIQTIKLYLPFLLKTEKHHKIQELYHKHGKELAQDKQAQQIFAQSFMQTDKHDQAHDILTNLYKLHPDDAQIAFQAAQIFAKKEQYAQALECLERLATLNRSKLHPLMQHIAQTSRIQLLIKLDRVDDACNQLEKIIPNSPQKQLWFSLLHACSKKTSPDKIIKHFETINKQIGETPWGLFYLADLYYQHKNKSFSTRYFDRALQLSDNMAVKLLMLAHRATLYVRDNNAKELKKVISNGLKMKADYPPLLHAAAHYYTTHEKNIGYAQQLINKALQHDKENPDYLLMHAYVLYKQKKYNKADHLLEQLQTKLNNNALLLIRLAQTKYKLGNTKHAKDLIARAEEHVEHHNEQQLITTLRNKWQK